MLASMSTTELFLSLFSISLLNKITYPAETVMTGNAVLQVALSTLAGQACLKHHKLSNSRGLFKALAVLLGWQAVNNWPFLVLWCMWWQQVLTYSRKKHTDVPVHSRQYMWSEWLSDALWFYFSIPSQSLMVSTHLCLFTDMLPSFLQKAEVVSEASRETCVALSDCLHLLTKQEGVGFGIEFFKAIAGCHMPNYLISHCVQVVQK